MINVTFGSLDEMLHFANSLSGLGQVGPGPTTTTTQEIPPTQQIPVSQTPVQQTTAPQTPEQTTPAVTTPIQNTAPTQQAPAQVQTTTSSYTMDDLTKAAVMLMDSGRQADLLNLLSQFGVEALPALPQEMYGAFATALRGLGAQI